MPIVFPGDISGYEPSRQSSGAQALAGTEKYNKLDGSTVSVLNIGSASITSLNADVITAGTLSADRIAAGAITATKLATDSVTSDKIAANSVTAGKISVSTLSAITANLGTVTAGTINGNTINVGDSSANGGSLNIYGTSGFLCRTGAGVILGGIEAAGGGYMALFGDITISSGSDLLMGRHIDMNSKNIYFVGDIYAHNFYTWCEVAQGINPFEVLASFESEEQDKLSGKSWGKLDHKKLDKSVYVKYQGKEGFDMRRLIEIQRQAILELKDEVEKLKSKK